MNQATTLTALDHDHARIIKRPDGFYWHDEASEYGPFDSIAKAIEDLRFNETTDDEFAGDEPSDFEPDETPEETGYEVYEIGISVWIDPETGEPAENGSPRIEEH